MNLLFFGQIFEESLNVKFNQNSPKICSMRQDGRTDRQDEANSRFPQFFKCATQGQLLKLSIVLYVLRPDLLYLSLFFFLLTFTFPDIFQNLCDLLFLHVLISYSYQVVSCTKAHTNFFSYQVSTISPLPKHKRSLLHVFIF
jgi:hypothetical protein